MAILVLSCLLAEAGAQTTVPQSSTLDARALGGEFKLPVFVIQGAEDFTTWQLRDIM